MSNELIILLIFGVPILIAIDDFRRREGLFLNRNKPSSDWKQELDKPISEESDEAWQQFIDWSLTEEDQE